MQCLAHIWPSQVSPPRDVLVPVTPENIDVLSSEREQIDPELQKIIDQYDTAIFDAFDEEKINATDDKAPKDANSWQDTAMDYVGSRSDSAASILPALAALNLSIDALDGAAIVQPPSHEGVSLPSDTENIKEGNNTYHIRGETIRDEPPLSQLDKFLAENLDEFHRLSGENDSEIPMAGMIDGHLLKRVLCHLGGFQHSETGFSSWIPFCAGTCDCPRNVTPTQSEIMWCMPAVAELQAQLIQDARAEENRRRACAAAADARAAAQQEADRVARLAAAQQRRSAYLVAAAGQAGKKRLRGRAGKADKSTKGIKRRSKAALPF